MALATNKTFILFGIETTYGVDPGLTGADAILVGKDLSISPLEGSARQRDFIRPFFGGSGSIRVENYATVSFKVELAGSGVAATPPAWGKIYKACNYSETIAAAAVTGTAQAGGSTTSIKLAAAASAIDDFYIAKTLNIVSGTGNAQTGEIISYDGTTKIATIAKAWAVAPDATSGYSIGAGVLYAPNSSFSKSIADSSATIYFIKDGVQHILLGAMGNIKWDLSPKAIPSFTSSFTGLLGTVTDVSLPAVNYAGYQVPATISTANTTNINLIGYTNAIVSALSLDLGNSVTYRNVIGQEAVFITDRKVTGNVTIDATTVAEKDWWTAAKNSATGPFSVKHGNTAGNVVTFVGKSAQIAAPSYADDNGISTMPFTLEFIPTGSAGNNDLVFCTK